MEATAATTPAAPAGNAPAPANTAVLAPAPAAENLTAVQEQPVDKPAPEGERPGGGMWLFGVIILVWIAYLYSASKNNKKKQQERENTLNSLAKGTKVVTIGGIHGVVVSTTDKTFTIKVDPNKETTLTLERQALARIADEKDGGNK